MFRTTPPTMAAYFSWIFWSPLNILSSPPRWSSTPKFGIQIFQVKPERFAWIFWRTSGPQPWPFEQPWFPCRLYSVHQSPMIPRTQKLPGSIRETKHYLILQLNNGYKIMRRRSTWKIRSNNLWRWDSRKMFVKKLLKGMMGMKI